MKRCEQNVEDHKSYQAKHAESAQWLEKAKKKFAECSEAGGSRAELEDRLEKVQVGAFDHLRGQRQDIG